MTNTKDANSTDQQPQQLRKQLYTNSKQSVSVQIKKNLPIGRFFIN
jgi:hypothetical protein